jgi:hypothetical protein
MSAPQTPTTAATPLLRWVSLRVPVKDLPLTPHLKEFVERAAREGVRRQGLEDDLKIRHYFGGWEVGLLPDEPGGPVVVSLVRPELSTRGDALDHLTPEERQRVTFDYPPRTADQGGPLAPHPDILRCVVRWGAFPSEPEGGPGSASETPLPRLLSLRVPLKDLPLPERLKKHVDAWVRDGGRRQSAEESLKLQHYFGGWEVGILRGEPCGPVVVALVRPTLHSRGDVLGHLTPEERKRVSFDHPPRADGEVEPLPPPADVLRG